MSSAVSLPGANTLSVDGFMCWTSVGDITPVFQVTAPIAIRWFLKLRGSLGYPATDLGFVSSQ